MHTPFFLFLEGIGGGELMVIVLFILIFFGANKIPELARGLGKGIREFKDASREIRSEIENAGAPPQQPYQQQFQQQPYQQQPAYQAPVADSPAAAPIAPPMDGGITPPVTPTPEAHPRPDQLN
ncbi:Sec-independent protein translocase subunit TatA/TatB [Hymenobacter pini]|uniref:Sec-independent protein translocase subunit TatA/TatB n=1 Tax=Hymenobacter pini TaxID=2880879 RepID=UPI00293D7D9F|nr:twin-arginine translocase TatA/TatE family subunit [Hymenobacter pini]